MSTIPSMASSNKTIRNYDLIPNGDYPARIVRFTGLGVQDQPAYQGQAKDPAFKAAFAFELFQADAATGQITPLMTSGTETKNGVTTPLEPQPACQFADMFLFPGASRGKVFDLVSVLEPGIAKVPGELSWFQNKLSEVVSVRVGKYTVKNGPNAGTERNTIVAITPFPTFMHNNVPQAASPLVSFDPYLDDETNFNAYSKLYKFQRDMLVEAKDSAHIPFAGKEPAAQGGVEQGNNEPVRQATATASPTAGTDTPGEDDMPF